MHVTFVPIGRSAAGKGDETLLDVARRAGVPLGNACGGVGICARCRVQLVEGAENLTPRTAIEARVSAERGLESDERLACQAVVLGNCTVTTPYW
jgi:2Fe-2S ferredoxin